MVKSSTDDEQWPVYTGNCCLMLLRSWKRSLCFSDFSAGTTPKIITMPRRRFWCYIQNHIFHVQLACNGYDPQFLALIIVFTIIFGILGMNPPVKTMCAVFQVTIISNKYAQVTIFFPKYAQTTNGEKPGPEVGTPMDCAKGTYAARSPRYRCLGRSWQSAGRNHPCHSHPATFVSQGAAGRVDMLKGCQPWSIGWSNFTLWMNQKMFDSSERLAILG